MQPKREHVNPRAYLLGTIKQRPGLYPAALEKATPVPLLDHGEGRAEVMALAQAFLEETGRSDTALNSARRIQEKNLNVLRSIQSRILFYSFQSEKQISWEIYFSKSYGGA